MSTTDQIVKWLKSKPGTESATSIADLTQFRTEIADSFELKETHPSIEQGLIDFLKLPREFKVRRRPTQVIDASENFDRSWVQRQRQVNGERYWPRLKDFLKAKRGRTDGVIHHLDDESDAVLECLSDPAGPDNGRVGMVVGHVQSGKTANMAALITKAADVGYKVIIVFAGVLDSLRQQTQRRFDEEVTAGDRDVWKGPWTNLVRVRRFMDGPEWVRQTTCSPDTTKLGDFKPPINYEIVRSMKDVPHLFVIKKNPTRLNKLKDYLIEAAANVGEGRFFLPTLIIDDEADQATINTKYNKDEVTKTNRAIRELLNSIKVRTYVGYTATPFANFLIDPTVDPTSKEASDLGADLFPKDFIVSLSPPEGYFGARQLFGISDPDDPDRNEPGMPVFRDIPIQEVENARSAKTRGNFESTFPTLVQAIDAFILSCAVRIVRENASSDMSMLVHPSSYQTIHDLVAEPIKKHIDNLKKKEFHATHVKSLKKLWESDFLTTTKNLIDNNGLIAKEISWADVSQHFETILNDIEVKVLNSSSSDELQYFDKNRPRRYIIVGGNKLSRGLTLEGLSISYFLRNSTSYDTLLQMGRWFGYRAGYVDVTRLFMTGEVRASFAMLAAVESDLREQLKIYERDKIRPVEAPPKIRRLPQLMITARNRMGAGQVDVDYSEIPTQVAWMNFHNVAELKDRNEKLGNFYSSIGVAPIGPKSWSEKTRLKKTSGFHIWEKPLETKEILKLINTISLGKIHKESFREYLEKLSEKNPQLRWYCAIAGVQDGRVKVDLNNFGIPNPITPTIRRSNVAEPAYIGNPDSPTDRELLETFMSARGLLPQKTAFLTTYILNADPTVLFANHTVQPPATFTQSGLLYLTAPVFRIYPQKTPPITVSIQATTDQAKRDFEEENIQPDDDVEA